MRFVLRLTVALMLCSAAFASSAIAAPAIDIAVTGDVVHAAPGTAVLVTATIANLDSQVVFLNGITSGVTPDFAQDDAFDAFASLGPDSLGPGEIWEGPILQLRIAPTAPLGVSAFDLSITGGASRYDAGVVGLTYFAIDDTSGFVGVPASTRLGARLRASPNPFDRSVGIDFTAPTPGRYEVAVFDVTGRRLTLLHSGEVTQGPHRWTWDGHLDAGGTASPGVFYVRVNDGRRILRTKVLKLD